MKALKFKVLLLGVSMVGKTSLMYRFLNNTFNENYIATLGAQFLSKEIIICSEEGEEICIKLIIWDIIGQSNPYFDDLRTTFYRGAEGAFLIFDLTREETLEKLNSWHKQLNSVLNKKIPLILIGNKLDLIENKLPFPIQKKAENFANNIKSMYIKTSAKTGKNINDAFLKLAYILARKAGYEFEDKKVINRISDKESENELFIKSRVQEYIQSKGYRVSDSLLNGLVLNKRITEILDKAIIRAKHNGRKTVKLIDI